MTSKEFTKSERQFTANTLSKLTPSQWQDDSLCDGWTVEDVAAHLIVREGLIAPIGIVFHSLHKIHDYAIRRVESKGHEYIIARVRKCPWYMPAAVNVAEFYVHNEDILRGGLHMQRPIPAGESAVLLWSSLKGIARIRPKLVSDLGEVTLVNKQTGQELHVKAKDGNKSTTITGDPGELLLYFYGRRSAAKVTIID